MAGRRKPSRTIERCGCASGEQKAEQRRSSDTATTTTAAATRRELRTKLSNQPSIAFHPPSPAIHRSLSSLAILTRHPPLLACHLHRSPTLRPCHFYLPRHPIARSLALSCWLPHCRPRLCCHAHHAAAAPRCACCSSPTHHLILSRSSSSAVPPLVPVPPHHHVDARAVRGGDRGARRHPVGRAGASLVLRAAAEAQGPVAQGRRRDARRRLRVGLGPAAPPPALRHQGQPAPGAHGAAEGRRLDPVPHRAAAAAPRRRWRWL